MNMFSNIITSSFKQIFKDAIDALLEETALTVPCKLVFDNTRQQECPNCIYDSISKKSSNQYKIGGPILFIDGQICPYCAGIGGTTFSSEETIYLGIIKPAFFNGQDELGLNNINYVEGKIQSLCSINFYAKIKNASYIIIDTNLEDIALNKYIRDKDPVPVGFGDNSYIITTWSNVQ